MQRIEKAIKVLKEGGIIVFPTDTAFGVGCRIDDKKAVNRLIKIKKRPKVQAFPVLVASRAMAKAYLQPVTGEVDKMMKKYWPGPLTIVFPCQKDKVSPQIRASGDTLGVRMPDHEVIFQLIQGVGLPILGPSANFHGQPTPYRFEDLDKNFLKLVDFVIPGECKIGKVSTVIDCSKKPWKIIRHGAVQI